MEIGVYTFGEATADTAQARLRDLVEEIELADQVGSVGKPVRHDAPP